MPSWPAHCLPGTLHFQNHHETHFTSHVNFSELRSIAWVILLLIKLRICISPCTYILNVQFDGENMWIDAYHRLCPEKNILWGKIPLPQHDNTENSSLWDALIGLCNNWKLMPKAKYSNIKKLPQFEIYNPKSLKSLLDLYLILSL